MWLFVVLAIIGIAVLAALIFASVSGENKKPERKPSYRHGRYRSFTADEKGEFGETLVANELRTISDMNFVMLNDIIVVTDGNSHQIDHVVINRYGVFVIETKNYAGKIYGNKDARMWRVYYDNGDDCEFYNPVQQNLSHCNSVKRIVGNVPIYSAIVFVRNNVIKTDAANVIPLSRLKYFVTQPRDTELTEEQVALCAEKLRKNQNENAVSIEEHVSSIKETQKNIEDGICPWCSHALVEKRGKYGVFMACSNYPRCKFTCKPSAENDRKAG